MTQKIRNAHLAVGHWSRDLHCRIQQEQTAEKLKALLWDKLLATGRRVSLWLPVRDSTPGLVDCTCVKDTRQASDFRCMSCYGTKSIPGFVKFLHETIFFSSAEFAGFTLTNVEIDRSIKPNRLRLTSAATTGTIITPDKAFTNPEGAAWEYQVAAFRKTATDTITVEYSTDAGATWTNITALSLTGSGNVRFRITLTRAALTTDSPDFEILRIRRAAPERMTAQSKKRADLEPGQILLLRTWVVEQTMRQVGMGRQTEFQNDQSWTADLAMFDSSIPENGPLGLINDRDAGPHPLFQHVSGVTADHRFVITQISHDDQIDDVFLHQAFAERRAQDGELYVSLVW